MQDLSVTATDVGVKSSLPNKKMTYPRKKSRRALTSGGIFGII